MISKKIAILKLSLPFILTSFSGCGVIPPKTVITDKKSDLTASNSLGYPFRLRRSVILVKHDVSSKTFKAQAAPYELDSEGKYTPIFYLSGIDNYRSTTQIKVTYIDNTKLIDELQVTTKDNVADTINKIGAVAAAVVPMFAQTVSGTNVALPVQFNDTVFDPADSKADQWNVDALNPGYCIRQRSVATEDGISMMEYLTSARSGYHADFPIPSCVTATIEIASCRDSSYSGEPESSIRVTYASHNQVSPMPLPSSGKLKMNSVCGAAVTEADNQERTQLTSYLTTLIANVNSVKAAMKKKN